MVPFCILLVYALGASCSFFVYILLFTDKKKEEKKAFLSGCKIEGRGGKGLVISHLLYIEDTLVFYESNQSQSAYLDWLLMWFEAISGLSINLNKSEIIPMVRVGNVEDWP